MANRGREDADVSSKGEAFPRRAPQEPPLRTGAGAFTITASVITGTQSLSEPRQLPPGSGAAFSFERGGASGSEGSEGRPEEGEGCAPRLRGVPDRGHSLLSARLCDAHLL